MFMLPSFDRMFSLLIIRLQLLNMLADAEANLPIDATFADNDDSEVPSVSFHCLRERGYCERTALSAMGCEA